MEFRIFLKRASQEELGDMVKAPGGFLFFLGGGGGGRGGRFWVSFGWVGGWFRAVWVVVGELCDDLATDLWTWNSVG